MKPPTKLKLALLVWCAIYPSINIITYFLKDIIAPLYILLKTLYITLILVPLMVYVFLPFIMKRFNKWLIK